MCCPAEPIAAALACGAGSAQLDENVLVFDLGGGTLDVSLLDSFEGALEVLDIDGDGHLGGNDFDEALANWLLPRHMLNEHATRMRYRTPADPGSGHPQSCMVAQLLPSSAFQGSLQFSGYQWRRIAINPIACSCP